MSPHPFHGGQGRTAADVEASGRFLLGLAIGAVVFFAAMIAARAGGLL